MPTKIRLSRHGKKGHAFYQIVVADGRAPRDGKYIEKIGSYDPNTNPATILLDTEKALAWIQKGAQPTDTVRTILSYKGVMYKNHLAKGVVKGALTAENAEKKFESWITQKEGKTTESRNKLTNKQDEEAKARFAAETKAKETKAKAIQAKNTPPPAEEPQAEAPQAEVPQAEVPQAEATTSPDTEEAAS
jgi:small subunit ribosomal protein S16